MASNLKSYGFMVVLTLLLAGMGIYLIVNHTGFGGKMDYPLQKEAPAFRLQDVHSGEQFSLEGTNGTVRLVYFYYSNCPDVCPPSTYSLSLVQEKLKEVGIFGSETRLISITFDPERDTPERLRDFAGSFRADPSGWHFLRGDEEEVRSLAREFGIDVIDLGNGDLAHQNIYFLIDKEGNIREYLKATEPDVDEIVKKIKGLL